MNYIIRTKVIVSHRKNGHTLQQIADTFNITRERVRQILFAQGIKGKFRIAESQLHKERMDVKKIRKYGKLDVSPLERLMNFKLSRIKHKAMRTELLFNLEIKDFLPLPTHCPILNIELDYCGKKHNSRKAWASFDRIDNTKGYINGNVHIISYYANIIKRDKPLITLINRAKDLTK